MKIYLVLIFAVLITGCDLFSTRDAQPPDQPRSNNQPAITAEILIENFVNSLKDKNLENYLACFADTAFSSKRFQFSPSSGAVSQFPALADNWSVKNEEQYFTNIKSKIPEDLPITLTLTNVSMSPQGDSVLYTASYSLNVPFTDPSAPTNFQGDLRFNLFSDSRAIWTISYWQDTKNSDLPSWSELKGRYY